jgi:hypothetical protein
MRALDGPVGSRRQRFLGYADDSRENAYEHSSKMRERAFSRVMLHISPNCLGVSSENDRGILSRCEAAISAISQQSERLIHNGLKTSPVFYYPLDQRQACGSLDVMLYYHINSPSDHYDSCISPLYFDLCFPQL